MACIRAANRQRIVNYKMKNTSTKSPSLSPCCCSRSTFSVFNFFVNHDRAQGVNGVRRNALSDRAIAKELNVPRTIRMPFVDPCAKTFSKWRVRKLNDGVSFLPFSRCFVLTESFVHLFLPLVHKCGCDWYVFLPPLQNLIQTLADCG